MFFTSAFSFSSLTFVDNVSTVLCLLSSFIAALCAIYNSIENKGKEFFSLYLAFLTGLLFDAFSTKDLLVFFVSFEATAIPMFLIILIWGSSRKEKTKASYLFLFYTLLGSLGFLYCTLFLYASLGSTYASCVPALPAAVQLYFWPLFFISFAVKLPLFPFYIWLPQAHVEAPTAGSVVLAAVLLKLGGYGMLRFLVSIFSDAVSSAYKPFVYFVMVGGIILSSLSAIRQTDLKRVIAYSSIAHMSVGGLAFFTKALASGLGSYTVMIAHGFVSAALFFSIGFLYDRHHSRIIKAYSGLADVMPLFSSLLLVFSLANIGFPLTFNFCTEFILFAGVVSFSAPLGATSGLGIILSGFFSMWLVNRVIFGPLRSTSATCFLDISWLECFILFALLLPTTYYGVIFNDIGYALHSDLLRLMPFAGK